MTRTATVGDLRRLDVPELARVHEQAFPGFFLSSLGEPFLARFYRAFLDDPSAVAVVARLEDGEIAGAAVGTTEPARFFGRLLRRQWLGLALASTRAVLERPATAARLARALTYRGQPPSGEWALLSSICVAPRARGRGVGRQLLGAWTERAVTAGGRRFYLTTDAEDNDAVNRFYRDQGWVLSATHTTREGREMHRYTRTVAD